MEEKVITPDCLVIMPNGEVLDKYLGLSDLPSGIVTIDGRKYRVVEAHVSAAPKWRFVLTVV